MKIEEILNSDPLFKNCVNLEHEPLNGGFSNETHIVTCKGIKYVVKINFAQNEYLKLTRDTELQAQQEAAKMGIAPKVLCDLNCKEYAISEFLNGHLLTKDEVKQDENIIELASILKKIHSIKGVHRTCSAFDLIDGYVNGISEFKVKLPEGYHDILHKAEIIRNKRLKDKINNQKYCHNDFLTINILNDNGKFGVLDWELSGIGDVYMDLATLPYQLDFSEEKEKLLLTSYFDYFEEEMLMTLRDMRYIGLVRELVWALFFEGMNQKSVNHDMDYHKFAYYALDRIQKGFLSI